MVILFLIMISAGMVSAQTVGTGESVREVDVRLLDGRDSLRIALSDSMIRTVDAGVTEGAVPLTYDEQIRSLNAKYKAMQITSGGNMRNVPEFSFASPVPGVIAGWDGGGIFGFTSMASLPGLMGIESGRLGLFQNFGRFSFTAYAAAEKYGSLNKLDRSVGFGGSLSFQASDQISFTVFGSYYSPLRDPRGAEAGYIAIPSVGGYMDYSFNEHWGVQVGAQGYRNSANGHWRTQPIVKPYYRINKSTAIGVDVGGILYNLMYNQRDKSNRRMQNPTVPIPRMGALPVGPRE
jgi:hypothetical protein